MGKGVTKGRRDVNGKAVVHCCDCRNLGLSVVDRYWCPSLL